MTSTKYERWANIGKSARQDAIAEAIFRSAQSKRIGFLSEVDNCSLRAKGDVYLGQSDSLVDVETFVKNFKPDFAIIGPEEPLAAGVVDRLAELGVPAIGPTKALAQIEASKSFTRTLFRKYQIPGEVRYRAFRNESGAFRDEAALVAWLRELGEFALKPDGLTGGKGVRVFGDHFANLQQGLEYCREVLSLPASTLVVEEKLDGEEFSLQSFCDGEHIVHMPPVQDHKRAFEGDSGPNTGGMGSYSCEDHSLPFLNPEDLRKAGAINEAVFRSLQEEVRQKYKGILYGSFILTKDGLKVIEYNARFGDPEALNVLSILKTDFIDICKAMIEGTLDRLSIVFDRKATVCKYVVPNGYPDDGAKGETIDLSRVSRTSNLRTYLGAVSGSDESKLMLHGSRAVGFVGVGDTLREAERVAERAASEVIGPVFHRKDIGTSALVQKRISHVLSIRETTYLPLERLRQVG